MGATNSLSIAFHASGFQKNMGTPKWIVYIYIYYIYIIYIYYIYILYIYII